MRRHGSLPVEIARAFGLLAAFLVTCLMAGILASGFLLPTAAAAGFLTRSGYDYYTELPDDLDESALPEYSTILASDGSLIANIYDQNRFIVPLSNVSQTMKDATLAIEDSRFYEHNGIDARGTLRAAVVTFGGNDVQGGSTLTQQYVKNVRLQTAVANNDDVAAEAATASGSNIEGYKRKLDEARYAMGLEEKYTKDEILEKYFNIAYFGNNAYGIAAAAKFYFSVDPAALNVQQAALLAGIVQRPTDLDPVKFPENAIARRNTVLARMLQTGKLTQEAHDAAVATNLDLVTQALPNGCLTAGEMAFFCDYVRQSIIGEDLPAGTESQYASLGATATERRQNLHQGGLTIQTTINPGLQSIAWQSARSVLADTERAGVALVSVQPGTGHILAMAENRIFGEDNGTFQVSQVNYATGGSIGFQPGSNFKPFTLAAWLKAGKPLSARVDASEPLQHRGTDYTSPCSPQSRSPYGPVSNAGDSGGAAGSVDVMRASYNSINTAYTRMAQQLDLCEIAATASSLGVNDIAPTRQANPTPGHYDVGPSLVLGSGSVSPLAMAGAYAAFGADGLFCPPQAVTGILDRDGQPVAFAPPACTQALEPDVARGVSFALEQTLIQGTARGTDIGRPAAGKTGTTQDFKDTWFTGYTPNLATSVWVGDTVPTPATLDNFPIDSALENGGAREYRSVFGSTFALPTWKNFMTQAPGFLGLPPADFPDPGQTTIYGPDVNVPSVQGLTVDEATGRLAGSGLGIAVSDERRAGPGDRVSAQTPGPGSRAPGGSTVTIYLGGGGGGGEELDGRGRPGDGNTDVVTLPPGIDARGDDTDRLLDELLNGRRADQTP